MKNIRGAINTQMVFKVLLLCLVFSRTSWSLTLVKDGVPQAEIIIADKPTNVAVEAASVLQQVIHQMTGALLPIRAESEYRPHPQVSTLLVGPSRLTKSIGVQVKQGQDEIDGYVIRTKGSSIALVGNDVGRNRGSIYAVYDLLERLGCGWYGPDTLWHVIPKQQDLVLGELDIDESPAFLMRDMWIIRDPMLHDAWRLGTRWVHSSRNLSHLVPRSQYQTEHPDYYAPRYHVCLTHPDVIEIVTKKLRAELDRRKDESGIIYFTLVNEDNPGFCECDRCRAFGNISARMLNLANEVSRGLAKTHPGRARITFLAYWFTHDPPQPMFNAEAGITILQVNEGNHVQPWDKSESPEVIQTTSRNNTRELAAFHGWRQTGATMGIWEWWVPGCSNKNWRSVPWYSGETALRNLRYWKAHGVRYITYETQYEHGSGFPLRWPLYYVGARGLWNPEQTVDEIMTEACGKLYGPAAKDMLNFYKVIERAIADSDQYEGNWHLPSPEKIYSPEIETQASRHLHQAAKATDEAAIRARIAQEQKMWDQAKATLSQLRMEGQEMYVVIVDGKSMRYRNPKVTTELIRNLGGIPDNLAIIVEESDGQTRLAREKEVFDLRTKVKFATKPIGK